jgi:hypothetical protein
MQEKIFFGMYILLWQYLHNFIKNVCFFQGLLLSSLASFSGCFFQALLHLGVASLRFCFFQGATVKLCFFQGISNLSK